MQTRKKSILPLHIAFTIILAGATLRAEEKTAPAPAEATPAPRPAFGYDGGFFLRTDDDKYKIKIGGQLQTRFEYFGEDTDGVDPRYAISIPRARLKISGNVFTPALRFELMPDFGKGSPTLKDYWADAELVQGWLVLRVGQTKRPFSRQQMTSSSTLEMNDTAITDKYFGAGYDLGVMFHNDYMKSPAFEWALGLFNGTGDKPWLASKATTELATADDGTQTATTTIDPKKTYFTNIPDEFRPAIVARIGYNYGGGKSYSEADLEGGPLRLGIGLSGQADLDTDDQGKGAVKGDLDFILKAHGFSLSGAGYVSSAQKADKDWVSQELSALGAHFQAGYVIGGFVQPVLRYAIVDPTDKYADSDFFKFNREQEILGGLSFYFFKHNAKWQTEGGALLRNVNDDGGGTSDHTDYVVRTQFQLAF
jgi:hypothetical protein